MQRWGTVSVTKHSTLVGKRMATVESPPMVTYLVVQSVCLFVCVCVCVCVTVCVCVCVIFFLPDCSDVKCGSLYCDYNLGTDLPTTNVPFSQLVFYSISGICK